MDQNSNRVGGVARMSLVVLSHHEVHHLRPQHSIGVQFTWMINRDGKHTDNVEQGCVGVRTA